MNFDFSFNNILKYVGWFFLLFLFYVIWFKSQGYLNYIRSAYGEIPNIDKFGIGYNKEKTYSEEEIEQSYLWYSKVISLILIIISTLLVCV
ncbi:hypothetical protein ACFLYP_03465 [Chloroflexota bacterium]